MASPPTEARSHLWGAGEVEAGPCRPVIGGRTGLVSQAVPQSEVPQCGGGLTGFRFVTGRIEGLSMKPRVHACRATISGVHPGMTPLNRSTYQTLMPGGLRIGQSTLQGDRLSDITCRQDLLSPSSPIAWRI